MVITSKTTGITIITLDFYSAVAYTMICYLWEKQYYACAYQPSDTDCTHGIGPIAQDKVVGDEVGSAQGATEEDRDGIRYLHEGHQEINGSRPGVFEMRGGFRRSMGAGRGYLR